MEIKWRKAAQIKSEPELHTFLATHKIKLLLWFENEPALSRNQVYIGSYNGPLEEFTIEGSPSVWLPTMYMPMSEILPDKE